MESPRRWRLDSSNTRVAFRVQWFGLARVGGSFSGVRGGLVLPGDDQPEVAVELTVDSLSVQTGIALRDRHLRGPRFLDGARHPTASFAGRAARRATGWAIRGTLTFRGRERILALAVPDEPSRDGRQTIRIGFQVPRREYGVGAATGIRRLNPLLWAIASDVTVEVEVAVPVTLLQPAATPARVR